MSDNNKRPDYYLHPSGVECVIVARHHNFCVGNVLKYLWRCHAKHPDPLDDLIKARTYLDFEIDRLREERGEGRELKYGTDRNGS